MMCKSFGSVALDILSYILAFAFSVLSILMATLFPENVIVHTDQGSQYCSADYQALLKRHNLRGSMSAKGCCYDIACVESFFHSLKVECIHGERFASREIMRTMVFNYIECDYNRWRRHSACGGLSPEQFENQNLA